MIIDTHCHLFKEEYDDLEDILKQLEKEKIIVIINGYNPLTNKYAIDLANKYKFIYATIGFHPSNINEVQDESFKILEKQLNNKKVVGIGEIGLDYYWNKNNKEKQKEILKKQLDLAKKYNKPIIVHSRDAVDDVYNLLKKYNLKGILHAFSGSLEQANLFINLGYKLGIGGVVTFKNSKLKEVIKNINLEYIVLETDAPYLTPEPYRGKKNKPIYVRIIAEKIADIKETKYNDVCQITTRNVRSLFDLDL